MKNEINATLKIPVHSEEQLKHIQNAELFLMKARVTFDTGYDLVNDIRDWELDYSLKGAILTKEERLVFDIKSVERMANLSFALVELENAGLLIESGIDEKNKGTWKFLKGTKMVIRK